mgnify:FL=1
MSLFIDQSSFGSNYVFHHCRKWHVQATCATNGEGLYEAMELLGTYTKEFKKRQQQY